MLIVFHFIYETSFVLIKDELTTPTERYGTTTVLDRTSDTAVHATCLLKTDLQSVRQRVLPIDMEPVCVPVHWGFNVGLTLV